MDNPQTKLGEKFMKSVFRASLEALLAIGIRSPHYFDQFTAAFSASLDKEFIKLGIMKETPVSVPSVDDDHSPSTDTRSESNDNDITKPTP